MPDCITTPGVVVVCAECGNQVPPTTVFDPLVPLCGGCVAIYQCDCIDNRIATQFTKESNTVL